jgi:hypothetical protein
MKPTKPTELLELETWFENYHRNSSLFTSDEYDVKLNEYRDLKRDWLASFMKFGQYFFTCKMIPVRFHSWERNAEGEGISSCAEDSDEIGSSHSVMCCGCNPVSDEYALWFIKNDMSQYFNKIIAAVDARTKHKIVKLKREFNIGDDYFVFNYNKDKGYRSLTSIEYNDITITASEWCEYWEFYESYVKQRAEREGLEYEGM